MLKRNLLPALLVLSLLLGTASVVLAEGPVRQEEVSDQAVLQQVNGVVLEVLPDEGKIRIQAQNPYAEVTVHTTADTRFVIPNDDDPGITDIVRGDQIVATGRWQNMSRTDFDARMVTVKPGVRPVEIVGVVKEIGDASLTLETRRGMVSVQVNDDTRFIIPGVRLPTLADVRVGDRANVKAVPAVDGAATDPVLVAQLVVIRRPQARPVELAGKVTEIGDTWFKLLSGVRTFIIDVNDDTTFVIPGVQDPTFADLQVGDKVVARVLAPDITATYIDAHYLALVVAVHRPQPRPVVLTGTVTAIDLDAQTFSLLLRSGETKTIAVTEDTKFHIPGMPDATLADVQVNDRAVVTGVVDPTGADRILAKIVAITRLRPRPERITGTVESIDITTGVLVVLTEDGSKTVHTDEDTRFCVPDVRSATVEDLADYLEAHPDARVVVIGFWNEDGTMQASIVALPDTDAAGILTA